jgi:hypothetical protein
MKKGHLAAAIAAAAALALSIALAAGAGNPQTGNGAPSGAHFNLNIHGVPGGEGYNGNTKNNIFVPLQGSCKINLTEGPFQVLQNDCINNPPAAFQLPDPCGGDTDCTNFVYAVYVRAVTPGSADMYSCFTDKTTGDTYCATGTMVISLNKVDYGKFTNVSQALLNVCDTSGHKSPLFSDSNRDEFWQYDNQGLRLAQLRFYEMSTPSGKGDPCTFTQVS